MKTLLLYYPKCSTCLKALKWLRAHGIDPELRDITLQRPSAQELQVWIKQSALPAAKFFNTSGLRYKELGLKNIIPGASDRELIELLSSDGMLVKRPILITDAGIAVGFREEQWDTLIKK